MTSREKHDRMANAIRFLSMDAVEKANSGHPGLPMGAADIATVLFTKFLKFDPANPKWPDRDRFVLSAGHGSMLLYSLLYLTGYEDMTIEEIKNFRQLGSRTAGHPEYGHASGIETTTGPLGQGLANSVGMAIAERHLNAQFGDDVVDHYTYVLAGDGCLMEGVSQEAIALAGHLKLRKLIVFWDNNNISIDGPVSLSDSTDQLARFAASGWRAIACDGHDPDAIAQAIEAAKASDKPTMIACKTLISKGGGPKEGDPHSHGYTLFDDEIKAAREAMGWTHGPFETPDDIARAWKSAGRRGAGTRRKWEAKLSASSHAADFTRAMNGDLPASAFERIDAYIDEAAKTGVANATRVHSGSALDQLIPAIPEMVGGSADLTGSNNTFVKGMKAFDTPDYAGRYVHYGIREFGMAAAMNGMAVHGGVIPYSGTFMAFADYSRPAIRLGALMGVRVIHVMTHDSIGLGEDGPTHQPVEHLASLRAMPNLMVMRPADAIEAAECWKIAVQAKTTPTVMALSRQKTPAARRAPSTENLSARGAYEIAAADGEAQVSIFASGTEVGTAIAARDLLQAKGVPTRVVSTPCWELFEQQDAAYRTATIGKAAVRVAVEAAVRQGWERFIGEDGVFIGMTGFGASAPYERLYKEFGITAEATAEAALKALG